MKELLQVLVMVVVLFIVLLFIQRLKKIKFCALCGAVFLSWITLLGLYLMGFFSNRIIIALLIGQSITGVYYLAEHYLAEQKVSKVSEPLTLFRLPFLLTLIIIGFSLLELSSGMSSGTGLGINPSNINSSNVLSSIVFVSAVWILFIFMYLFRSNSKLQNLVKKMIECCKKW